MAFFKFPWAGQPQEPEKSSPRRGRAPEAQSIEELRRRARHRLIGAVVLVLAGVVVFPLVFDTQPRTVPVDVAIEIPDRNAVAPLTPPDARPDAQGPAADAGLSAGEQQVPAATAKVAPPASSDAQGAAKPASPSETKTEPKAQSKAEESKPEPKPEAKPAPRAEPRQEVATPAPAAGGADGARAKALLEGRAKTAVASVAPAPTAGEQSERFIVQVGAWADEGTVREVRAKLERAGLKTYAQAVRTKEGVLTTRVRLGPFASRADANKALERAKGLGLNGVLLTL